MADKSINSTEKYVHLPVDQSWCPKLIEIDTFVQAGHLDKFIIRTPLVNDRTGQFVGDTFTGPYSQRWLFAEYELTPNSASLHETDSIQNREIAKKKLEMQDRDHLCYLTNDVLTNHPSIGQMIPAIAKQIGESANDIVCKMIAPEDKYEDDQHNGIGGTIRKETGIIYTDWYLDKSTNRLLLAHTDKSGTDERFAMVSSNGDIDNLPELFRNRVDKDRSASHSYNAKGPPLGTKDSCGFGYSTSCSTPFMGEPIAQMRFRYTCAAETQGELNGMIETMIGILLAHESETRCRWGEAFGQEDSTVYSARRMAALLGTVHQIGRCTGRDNALKLYGKFEEVTRNSVSSLSCTDLRPSAQRVDRIINALSK
ncbi:MAG: hypothetical protein LC114_04080 [Bryobacterales bacterium]|nr:hypothetical protein [Bryobacterales bacterium]